MKAMVCTKYGSPEVFKLQEVEKPVPKDNEVLIRIMATVVSPSDCAFRKGEPFIGRLFSGLIKPKNTILGDSFAGEIESIGKSVKLFKVGDQVCGTNVKDAGAYSEYIALPENGALALKPTNMNYEEAAPIGDGVITAFPFLKYNGHIEKGQNVLINGASGSVGTAAIQIAKYYGATVTAVCSGDNVELVRSLGADQVIDYTQEDFHSSRQTYDIVFDVIAKSSFTQCKKILTPNGIYLSTFPTLTLMLQMLRTSKRAGKRAVFAATGLRPPGDKAKDLIVLKEIIEAGKIKTFIDRCYPLEQIAEAHRYVEQGHKKGNVVITVK